MNTLVWKLLLRRISKGQFISFFLADLLGLSIVLLGWQFYRDVLPVFTQGDSFMKENYMVVGKRVTTAQTLLGGQPNISPSELDDLRLQPFVASVGRFTPALFDVYASVGSEEMGVSFGTEMFFESIPDNYIDADLSSWQYVPGSDSLPVILPRNYLNLYNFGFASTRRLPVLSEGLVRMVNMKFRLRGTHGQRLMKGRVVAFSDRLNTILVPQQFMEEVNASLSPDRQAAVSRVIVAVKNPADERIAPYFSAHQYEVESGAAETGQLAYFLRLIIGVVLGIGLVICALSLYILILSISLLMQKHTDKIDHLLQLGYTVGAVALPFHLISLVANMAALAGACATVVLLRAYYLPVLGEIYPQISPEGVSSTLVIGVSIVVSVLLLNYLSVKLKVVRIWHSHR